MYLAVTSRDTRSRRQKLLAMAADPGASEGERANARTLLEKLYGLGGNPESPERATRASVHAAPSESRRGRGVRVRYPNGTWVHLDEADIDWEMVDAHRLDYRFDGDPRTYQGKGRREWWICSGHDRPRRYHSRDELLAHMREAHRF